MTAKAPPVPPENLTTKGPEPEGSVAPDVAEALPDEKDESRRQGQSANTRINLTPQNSRGLR